MNTCRVATVAAKKWAVERILDGVPQGLDFGPGNSRVGALSNAFSLTRVACCDANRSTAQP